MSCYDFIVGMTTDMENLLVLVYQACANEIRLESTDNLTACSQDGAVAVQVFVSNIICCYLESLEPENQVINTLSSMLLLFW